MLIKSRPSNHSKNHDLFNEVFAFNRSLWSFFIIGEIVLLVTPSPIEPLLIDVHDVVHWIECGSIWNVVSEHGQAVLNSGFLVIIS